MKNNVFNTLKNFFSNNYKLLLVFAGVYLFLTLPLSVYIYMPGGSVDTSNKVVVENEYSSLGSLNFSYVSEVRGTIPTALLSYLINSWDIVDMKDVVLEDETYEDASYRNDIYFEQAVQNAVRVAYKKANKEFKINNQYNYIVYVSTLANTNLEVGDEVISIENEEIKNTDEYSAVVSNSESGDIVDLVVKRNGITFEKTAEVINYDDYLSTGIYFITLYDYEVNPKVSFDFNDYESGRSGGLMLALTIYDKLTEEDITKGYKIVGTGFVDENGNVGSVDGIEYKILGAVKDGADIFFIPSGENYEEAVKLKEEQNLNINIVGISSFDEALKYLNGLK